MGSFCGVTGNDADGVFAEPGAVFPLPALNEDEDDGKLFKGVIPPKRFCVASSSTTGGWKVSSADGAERFGSEVGYSISYNANNSS